jgi:hypothetical protein
MALKLENHARKQHFPCTGHKRRVQEHNLGSNVECEQPRISTAVQEIVLHERLSKKNEMDSRGYSKLNIIVYALMLPRPSGRFFVRCARFTMHTQDSQLHAGGYGLSICALSAA